LPVWSKEQGVDGGKRARKNPIPEETRNSSKRKIIDGEERGEVSFLFLDCDAVMIRKVPHGGHVWSAARSGPDGGRLPEKKRNFS